jgi:hypothetical protein
VFSIAQPTATCFCGQLILGTGDGLIVKLTETKFGFMAKEFVLGEVVQRFAVC